MSGQGWASWNHGAHLWQDIDNERPIPPRRAQRDLWPHVPVIARLVWTLDGPQLVATTADIWARVDDVTDIHIELFDPRRRARWLWLSIDDVHRTPDTKDPPQGR